MIVAQQPAEALSASYWPGGNRCWIFWLDQDVADPLVCALGMIVGDIFGESAAQAAFAEEDHLGQALRLDRAHEAFAMGVEIWALWWQEDRLHPTGLEQCIERLRVFRVVFQKWR